MKVRSWIGACREHRSEFEVKRFRVKKKEENTETSPKACWLRSLWMTDLCATRSICRTLLGSRDTQVARELPFAPSTRHRQTIAKKWPWKEPYKHVCHIIIWSYGENAFSISIIWSNFLTWNAQPARNITEKNSIGPAVHWRTRGNRTIASSDTYCPNPLTLS